MTSNMWLVFALLSALFAALTSIFAKVGIEGVNSNLATALRTIVVLIMAWGMVFITKSQGGIDAISTKSWVFLILSGLATGASWLCYFKALQIGDASKVEVFDGMNHGQLLADRPQDVAERIFGLMENSANID